jgi:hypothetical protein
VVQNRHKLRTEMVQFWQKAFCRFVSAELFSFLLKGPPGGPFSFLA